MYSVSLHMIYDSVVNMWLQRMKPCVPWLSCEMWVEYITLFGTAWRQVHADLGLLPERCWRALWVWTSVPVWSCVVSVCMLLSERQSWNLFCLLLLLESSFVQRSLNVLPCCCLRGAQCFPLRWCCLTDIHASCLVIYGIVAWKVFVCEWWDDPRWWMIEVWNMELSINIVFRDNEVQDIL